MLRVLLRALGVVVFPAAGGHGEACGGKSLGYLVAVLAVFASSKGGRNVPILFGGQPAAGGLTAYLDVLAPPRLAVVVLVVVLDAAAAALASVGTVSSEYSSAVSSASSATPATFAMYS